jgi:hypothetical protein
MMNNSLPELHSTSILGLFGINLSSMTNTVLDVLTRWVALGAGQFVDAFTHALNSSTAISFGAGFDLEYEVLRELGLELVAPLLFIVIVQAVFRHDVDLLWRTVVIRIPSAMLLSSVAVEVVSLLVGATDAVSADLLGAAHVPANDILGALTRVLVATGGAGAVLAGFEGLFLAGLTVIVAFICWLELVVRSASISVATLFIPIALAGLVWPATQHWARRLGETIGALVFGKLVVAAVFALAAATIGTATGVNGVVAGIALFVLAALAPFSLLKLLPMFESGSVGHLEALSGRANHLATSAASAAIPIASDFLGPVVDAGSTPVEGVGYFAGDPQGDEDIARRFAELSGQSSPGQSPGDASEGGHRSAETASSTDTASGLYDEDIVSTAYPPSAAHQTEVL